VTLVMSSRQGEGPEKPEATPERAARVRCPYCSVLPLLLSGWTQNCGRQQVGLTLHS
jgi:hypothetical protein